jgi:hypothetical protein
MSIDLFFAYNNEAELPKKRATRCDFFLKERLIIDTYFFEDLIKIK